MRSGKLCHTIKAKSTFWGEESKDRRRMESKQDAIVTACEGICEEREKKKRSKGQKQNKSVYCLTLFLGSCYNPCEYLKQLV